MIVHVFPPLTASGEIVPLRGTVDPPSSKNFTTRYLVAGCLAKGRSVVCKPAIQDDAVAAVRCLRALGATITALNAQGLETEFSVENGLNIDRLEIQGFGSEPKLANPAVALDPGNAGAVFRILLAVSALLPEVRWETHHADSLGKRPNEDLVDALRQLGVEIDARQPGGLLPMTVRGGLDRIRAFIKQRRADLGIVPGDPYSISVSGEISSQFTSALLFLIPLLDEHIRIDVVGKLKSLPLIETTRNVLAKAGVEVESSPERHIHEIRAGQSYRAQTWETNGDWPGSAAIFAAAAAVPGSQVTVLRLEEDDQGEKESLPFYVRMGCTSERAPSGYTLRSPGGESLHGVGVNGDLCTDAVLAMMGAAMLAEGESRFVQIGNLQFKECDRVREPIAELRKVYATALEAPDGSPWRRMPAEKALRWEPDNDPDTIHINGVPQGFRGGIDVDGRGDHRVIMMLSIVALRCREGLRIHGAEHVAKSFARWFDLLRELGVRVDVAV